MPADPPSSGRRVPFGLMVIGSEMASFTIVGLLLDFALRTMPWLTILFTLSGLAVAFFHLVKMSQSLTAKKPPDSSNPSDGTDGGTP